LTEYITIIIVLKNQTRTRKVEKKYALTQSLSRIFITETFIKESQSITHIIPRSDVKEIMKEITRFNLFKELKSLINIFRIL
jgi:ribosome biogenesis protein Nip4